MSFWDWLEERLGSNVRATPKSEVREEEPEPENTPQPSAELTTPDYSSFVRESPWKDQGKDLLTDSADFDRWVKRFRPGFETPENKLPNWDKTERGLAFEVAAPLSYPAIVIYTRIRRLGLTECEFYWEYAYPLDFHRASSDSNQRGKQEAKP